MKFLFLGLLFAVSCGKIEKSNTVLGEEVSYNPVTIQSEEMARLTQLCSTLAQKSALIGQGTSEIFNFSLATKNCEENSLGQPSIVGVNLEITVGSYRLRRVDTGALFVYPDIETNQSGVMKEICGSLNTLTNPKKLANGNILRFTTSGISTSDCNPLGNERCILLEVGTPSGSNFKITTKEWMKFQMDPTKSRLGFFTERRTLSSALCAQDNFTQTLAILQ